MMIRCQGCGHKFEPKPSYTKVSCPRCANVMDVPEAKPTNVRFDSEKEPLRRRAPIPPKSLTEGASAEGTVQAQTEISFGESAQPRSTDNAVTDPLLKENLKPDMNSDERESLDDLEPSIAGSSPPRSFSSVPSPSHNRRALDTPPEVSGDSLSEDAELRRRMMESLSAEISYESIGSAQSGWARFWKEFWPTLLVCILFLGWMGFDRYFRFSRADETDLLLTKALVSLEARDYSTAKILVEKALELNPESKVAAQIQRNIASKGRR